jgi:hypothetical protein
MLADSLAEFLGNALGNAVVGNAFPGSVFPGDASLESVSLGSPLAASTAGWVFIALIAASVALPGCLVALARRRLPPSRRGPIPLEPLAFGASPRVRRSPRHPVGLHRSLLTSVFVLALGLVLICFAAAIHRLGVAGIAVTILFAGPTLVVALHARRRSLDS